MNITQILADSYRRLRYAASPAAAVTTRLLAFANETHRELLTMPGMERLRDDVLAWTITADVARQGLPPIVGRIKGITDRTNNYQLEQVPINELRRDDPQQAFTGGYAMRYAVVGDRQVAIQPTVTGSGLWIASSSNGDAGPVAVEAARLGGFPFYDTITTSLIGTTRVSVKSVNTTATVTDYIEVDRFYMATTNAVGYVSLYDAATSGNELARIPIGMGFARYLTVELWPVPTSAITLYVDYTRVIPEMTNTLGTDEPLLPTDFHDLITLGIRVKEYEFLDDSRIAVARADYERRKKALQSWMLNDGDRVASLRKTQSRWNSFGPNYPSNGSSW